MKGRVIHAATPVVYVADGESDMIELMARTGELDTPADKLLRAQHDRALPDGQKLWQTVPTNSQSGPSIGGHAWRLPGSHKGDGEPGEAKPSGSVAARHGQRRRP